MRIGRGTYSPAPWRKICQKEEIGYEPSVQAAPELKFFVKKLAAKNQTQQLYIDTLKEGKIVMCIGPAGTGKSYLVTHVAIQKLINKEIKKIILTRPIVATEDIGYLPGTLEEKIHPYLKPLLDAIEDHVGVAKAKELLADGLIEFSPLAFMRGRTINDAFVILDEAQNVNKEQMKMFLTRIGYNSTFAINGDHTQSDLKDSSDNGLKWAVDRLRGSDGDIMVVEFNNREIVRNPLIEKILNRLEVSDKVVKSATDNPNVSDFNSKNALQASALEIANSNSGNERQIFYIDVNDDKPESESLFAKIRDRFK